jgi:hypothetical protein
MITGKHIVLTVILASLLTMALIIEDWRDAKVVGIMVGIFILGRILRNGFR